MDTGSRRRGPKGRRRLHGPAPGGFAPAFLESVARMAPKRIVYVSCNPETMARDLALLTQKGYRAEGFTPVDMFPHSAHCEVVGSLVRVK